MSRTHSSTRPPCRRAAGSIALVAAAAAMTPATASASFGSTIKSAAWVRDCSNVDLCPPFTTLPAGTRVRMNCWRDESNAPGYGSWGARWFEVSAESGVEGYVHATYVGSQTATPNCTTVLSEAAVRWAINGIGMDAYRLMCLAFVHDAYRTFGHDIGRADTAWNYWATRPARQARTWYPPRGSLMFWDQSSNSAGHVALALGGQRGVSTWTGSTSPNNRIHAFSLAHRARGYVGWIWP